MLVPAINSVIKMIIALDAVASLVRPRLYAATPTKGRAIERPLDRCPITQFVPSREARVYDGRVGPGPFHFPLRFDSLCPASIVGAVSRRFHRWLAALLCNPRV
jgi:hypothetical protein